MIRSATRLMLLFLFVGGLGAQGTKPERIVHDNVITSEQDPRVDIQVPVSAQYVGADRWELFGIADCELHIFVEADGQRNVERVYWVQFEQYLPTKPELHHQYDSPRHAALGGRDFYVDTAVGSSDEKPKPGSDGEHVRALIDAKGYKRARDTMYVRFVHLLDEAKRKELMVIYAEGLAPTGFTAADLREGGKARDQWAKIENGLIERAQKEIRISFTGGN